MDTSELITRTAEHGGFDRDLVERVVDALDHVIEEDNKQRKAELEERVTPIMEAFSQALHDAVCDCGGKAPDGVPGHDHQAGDQAPAAASAT